MASVRKRKWVYNGVQKEGWEVRYFDSNTGKRPSKTFSLKKEADAFKRKVEREIEEGVHTAPSQQKVIREVADLYLRHCEQRIADGSLSRGRFSIIRIAVEKHILPRFGERKLDDLRMHEVEDWANSMKRGGRVSARTTKEYTFIFKRLEDYAKRRGYTKKSVVADAYAEVRCVEHKKIKTFMPEQIRQMMETVAVRHPWQPERSRLLMEIFLHLGAFCGLRFGEVCGLTRDDIDFDASEIRVRHSLDLKDHLKGPKTRAGVRDVPMSTDLVALLRVWLSSYFVPNKRDLVFRTSEGTRIEPSNFHRDCWRPLLVRAAVESEAATDHFHYHALRHFCASWLIANGMPLPDVAAFLGHSKFDMTLQVYAHSISAPTRRHEVVRNMVASLRAA